MKRLVLLIVLMGSVKGAYEMAIRGRDFEGGRVQAQERTANPPAWLGNQSNFRREREVDEGGANPFEGAVGGAGRAAPAWFQNEYQGYMQPSNAGDVANPNVPIAALGLDADPRAVQTRLKFGAPNLGTSDTQYQNRANALPAQAPQAPAWLSSLLRSIAPAWGAPVFNPRTGMAGENPEMTGAAGVPNAPGVAAPSIWTNPYAGQPVNDSMSDTLRSRRPITRGNSMSLSDLLRTLAAGGSYPMTAKETGAGMGSSYGGNWGRGRGGGGGGGYGGGGYGYDQYPGWAADMGLYSLKWGS